jgi:hypothetical protein
MKKRMLRGSGVDGANRVCTKANVEPQRSVGNELARKQGRYRVAVTTSPPHHTGIRVVTRIGLKA